MPTSLIKTVPPPDPRFAALDRLYGRGSVARFAAARVMVVGLGGVGSWTVEALARSGVGRLALVDLDDVCITNTNRQLHALGTSIGRPKATVLAERIQQINPACRTEAVTAFYTPSTAAALLDPAPDAVVDAIDGLSEKCHLLLACRERGIPVITAGGAGGRTDATRVRIDDLACTTVDPLLRMVRKTLRRKHGFTIRERVPCGIAAVYSPERPRYPWADGSVCERPEAGSSQRLDCAEGLGTAAPVTGAFGLAAAGWVLRTLVGGRETTAGAEAQPPTRPEPMPGPAR
ncbi:MAG: tRNA threonylcarbamoyladenosine dehydratase [Puniceicoccaceae bacterium]|nr:MAG: tRNA threonylcarbamoyladenosine dehydratase [Puniceicoccaceae bacterium]